MHRTTIMLSETLRRLAKRRAADLGVSLGELIRQLLERDLVAAASASRASDVLFASAEVWEGECPTDLAARHDEYLYGELDGEDRE